MKKDRVNKINYIKASTVLLLLLSFGSCFGQAKSDSIEFQIEYHSEKHTLDLCFKNNSSQMVNLGWNDAFPFLILYDQDLSIDIFGKTINRCESLKLTDNIPSFDIGIEDFLIQPDTMIIKEIRLNDLINPKDLLSKYNHIVVKYRFIRMGAVYEYSDSVKLSTRPK